VAEAIIEAEPIICRDPEGAQLIIRDGVDDGPAFANPTDPAIRKTYDEEGYVVLRGLLPLESCRKVQSSFLEHIKPSPDLFYRQTASGLAERHRLNEHGHMVNALLNIHDLQSRPYGGFRGAAMDVVCHASIQAVLGTLFSEPGTLVQTMYFEGNPATWAHQDTYYLDSTDPGRLTACWIALEDIAPGAGRFYVYPRSHRLAMKQNAEDVNFSFRHDEYKRHVLAQIRANDLELRAPALKAGDVLFWNSRTIHGSLETVTPERTRHSITAHYIPASTKLLQFQSRVRTMRMKSVQGMQVHHPKDLDLLRPRLALWAESAFPATYAWTRRLAIRCFTH
jgi:phytanoyl-CoA hydroxylase